MARPKEFQNKKIVQVSGETETFAKFANVGHNNYELKESKGVNTALIRLFNLLERETPRLTLEEWTYCVDSLNGFCIMDEVEYTAVTANLVDSSYLDSLHEKYDLDQTVWCDKINSWSRIQAMSVAWTCEQYWNEQVATSVQIADFFNDKIQKITEV